jgi:hypothetical protein
MRKINVKWRLIILPLWLFLLSACEDLLPTDYIPKTFVEAYLIVDEPIRDVILMKTQPVEDSLNYRSSMIEDAIVRIIEPDGNVLLLSFIYDSLHQGYYYPDTSYKVKPGTKYKLEITLKDGSLITGATTTPARTSWVNAPKEVIQFPEDSVDLPEIDSLAISWKKSGNTPYYLIRVTCLDTLEYGKYLVPPTDEKNRRTPKPPRQSTTLLPELTRWIGPIPNTEVPFVWSGLKWFGRNSLTVFSPDYNFMRWFVHFQRRSQYEPLLGSVNGAMGVFGSAAIVSAETMILKNQP